MSQACKSPKTFIAGEALAAFRRVKITSGVNAVYADQADSDGYHGFTEHQEASGDNVAIALKTNGQTFKVTAADSFAIGALLYAADDGKVSDTASGRPIGVALEAASGNNSVIEMMAITQIVTDPNSLTNHAVAQGAVPFVVFKAVSGAATTAIFDANAPRKFRVIDAWSIGTSAAGGTWKLTDGTNDICAAVTQAASDTDIDRAAGLNDAYYEIAAAGTLSIVHTGASLAATVYVLCLPVA